MVSSVTARDGGSPNASYLTFKYGLNAYTGRYYGARSICCNCICLGVLEQTSNMIRIPLRTVALRGWRHLFRQAASQRLTISLRGSLFSFG